MDIPANNLNGLIDRGTFEALNVEGATNFDAPMRSVNDEQIIIRAAFQTPVKISKISIRSTQPDCGPKNVSLYINTDCPSFDEIEDLKAQQKLQFTKEQITTAAHVSLRYVNFQNVRSIVVFIQDNQDDQEFTEVSQIVFWGFEEQSMDMKKWDPKKEGAAAE